jgi:benzoyl-CoA reductase/2-hydroxyglutaryl-CoA dehydratase subunit BcrC/BadD/HgdB
MTALETFQTFYRQRWNYDLIARSWKEQGGKIIGYSDINCPEEIVMAADCLPLLMTGDPESGTEKTDKHLEPYFSDSARHFYEAVVTERYHFVDLICFVTGDCSLSWIFHYFQEEKILNPALEMGEPYFLDRLPTRFAMDREFNLGRLLAFRSYLEDFAGKRISDDDLARSFAVTNETKKLLKEVSALRKLDQPRITGSEALQIIMSSMLMPKTGYNALLRKFLDDEAPNRPAQKDSNVRLFVSGSNLDNPNLYDIIESMHVTIVGEDTAFGDRYCEEPIDETLEPMEALVDRYMNKPLDPWMYGIDEIVKYRADAAQSARAQGVLFFQLRRDDPLAWDYPMQKKELEKRGIPVLLLNEQDYRMSNPEEARLKIEAFINNLSGRG